MNSLKDLNTIDTQNITDVLNHISDYYCTIQEWDKSNLLYLTLREHFCIGLEEIKILYCEKGTSDMVVEIASLIENLYSRKTPFYQELEDKVKKILIQNNIHGGTL